MTLIQEGNLQFEFGGEWKTLKYDENGAFYRTCLASRIEPTKAVDILCVCSRRPLVMMEIKDYSRTPFSSERFDGLPMDVAIKVRDTLAGIIGGAHNTENVFERHFFKNAFEYLDAPPQVVLFYVDPVSKSERPPQRSKNKQDVLQKNLRKHLRWLTRNVVIVGLNNYANMIAGLTVRQKI